MAIEKILLISDTHGEANLLKRIMRIEGKIDRCIHMGDREGEDEAIKKYTKAPLESVRGNCDYDNNWPADSLTMIGNYTVFLTHGHRLDVGYSTFDLEDFARDCGADMAFFGHTHVPYFEEMEDGFILCNPGSLARPRQQGRERTYVIITHDEKTGEITFEQKCL